MACFLPQKKTSTQRASWSEQLSRTSLYETTFLYFGSPDSLFHQCQQCQDQYAPQTECTFTKPAVFAANVPSGPLLVTVFTHALQTDQKDSLAHYKVRFLLFSYLR